MGESHLAASQRSQAELQNFVRDHHGSYMYIQLTSTKPCPLCSIKEKKTAVKISDWWCEGSEVRF